MINPNDRCPCGSNKKARKCCGVILPKAAESTPIIKVTGGEDAEPPASRRRMAAITALALAGMWTGGIK